MKFVAYFSVATTSLETEMTAKQFQVNSSRARQAPVSDNELTEINRVLANMKALASDIGVEQDAQLQEIGDLTKSVGRATDRVADNVRRVKKLT